MNTNRYDDAPATGGSYLKLESGESARFRIMSTPLNFRETFVDKVTGKSRTADQWAWAVLYKSTTGSGTDMIVNFEAKTFKVGAMIYGAVRDLVRDADWGDPSEYDIEVTRTGEGIKTNYRVLPKSKSQSKPEHLALFAEHGYDAGNPDWADAWLTRQYIDKDNIRPAADASGPGPQDHDPFGDE